LALGLEQEFFVVPKKTFLQRQDLRMAGRCLFGRVAAKNQQFSDHYYGKMPVRVEDILKEVEGELLEVGIPFKTKHNEVANNQFEFCAIYEEAGKSIFQNLVTMQILK
jgi:glutamine synthetase